jgi:hypothetical protein
MDQPQSSTHADKLSDRSYGSYTLGFPRAGQWCVHLHSDWQGYSADFGNHLGYDTVAIPSAMDTMAFQATLLLDSRVAACEDVVY